MGGMCSRMMSGKRPGTWAMFVPGTLLIAAGLLIILVPTVIVWLLGGAAILMGIGCLFMALGMRKHAGDLARRFAASAGSVQQT